MALYQVKRGISLSGLHVRYSVVCMAHNSLPQTLPRAILGIQCPTLFIVVIGGNTGTFGGRRRLVCLFACDLAPYGRGLR